MSTSTHPIIVLSNSNVEDGFSSTNTPDYTPASSDYSPASPGNTSSDPSEDLSKDLLASLAISPFHDDPYIKVMQAYNATNDEDFTILEISSFPIIPSYFAFLQVFKIGESSHKTSLERHEEQIETILNHLDELPLERIEHIEHIEHMEDKIEGLGNGQVIIQQDFDQLETELQEAHTQIAGFQRKKMGHDDEIVLARVRTSTLEILIEDIQVCHRSDMIESLDISTEGAVGLIRWFERTESVFSRSNCTEDCKVKFATGTLTKEALSRWNLFAQPIGIEESYKITWSEFKELLIKKYCPRTEVKKMEDEFYNLTAKGNDLKTYVRRFQELEILCPTMVPNSEKLMMFHGGITQEKSVSKSKQQCLWESILAEGQECSPRSEVVTGAAPVARAPYRLVPSEMQEIIRSDYKSSRSNISIMQFLGHVIDSQGIHVDPAKIEAVKNWASPTIPTKKELNMRQHRWLELLTNYDCEIRYHLGKANVVADALSRKERIKPLRVVFLYRNIVLRHGVSISIISDRDSHFTSRFWQSMQNALGTQLDMSTAYHPETDGQSERTIQTLEDMLRACVIDFGKGWERHLPLVEFSYNNSYHASIKAAPFEALYGRKCRSPVCWAKVGDVQLTGPEIIHETTKKIVQIRQRLQAQDRQRSFPIVIEQAMAQIVWVDANNGIYPVAYDIVEAESKASWCWFLNLLGEDLGEIIQAIASVFPSDEHSFKDQVSILAKDKRFGHEMHKTEESETGNVIRIIGNMMNEVDIENLTIEHYLMLTQESQTQGMVRTEFGSTNLGESKILESKHQPDKLKTNDYFPLIPPCFKPSRPLTNDIHEHLEKDPNDCQLSTPNSHHEIEEVSSDEDVDEWLNAEISKCMIWKDKEKEEDALIDILKTVVEELNNLKIYVMADVGAGINMMPKSLFEHLKLTNLRKQAQGCEREQINDSPNNVNTKKPKENIHAIQASFKNCEGAHRTMEYPLEKEDKAVEQSKYLRSLEETVIKFCEKVKERTTMGKDYIKEPVPRNLPAQFLGNPYRTRKTICAIGIPKEIKEDKGDINDGSDITIEDVERLRKILTPPIHALSNLKPIVQPYMPLGLIYNKEKVVKEEEQDYDIPLHEHVMQPLTPQTVRITSPDNDYVASDTNPILNKYLNGFEEEFADNTRVSEKIDSNPVNDLKELLKTYDFENFIRKLKHQLSQSSHETGSLYKKVEFEVPLTRIHVVVRFCLGVTT
ncbi:reverse transcriptase domain-containing protein [Tanacetum coccineum]